MGDIINLLPDSIANQIAAGEVIQRPASVVKELMENAVDAGAKKIQLIVKEAGRTLIQVIDDGKGMSPMDARLCWERHATSKIKQAEDLFNLHSFGFRGEALASIAAVAQVEMKTRQAHSAVATWIQVDGSEFKKQESAAAPEGTNIAVKNLFFNLPARRNFLKSNAVEFKHIIEEFTRVAMPNPGLHFVLYHNDQLLFDLHPTSQLKRIADLLSVDSKELISGEERSPTANFELYLGTPKLAKRSRGEQYFILNGRFIKDAYLNHAISSVYKDYIAADLFPFYVVFIHLPPATVDINVHPTKTEVKFEDEKTLYALLKAVVKKILAQSHLGLLAVNNQEQDSFAAILSNPSALPEFPSEPRINVNPGFNPFTEQTTRRPKQDLGKWQTLFEGMEKQSAINWPPIQQHEDLRIPGLFPETEPAKKKDFQQVIQWAGAYIVAVTTDELFVIHQQRAHQRVLFERYLQAHAKHQSASQQLLFPRVLELSAKEAALLEDLLDDMKHLGFDIGQFGNGSFIINGLPALADKTEAKWLVEGLLEEYQNSGQIDKSNRMNQLAKALARKSAITTGKLLSVPEMTELANDLMKCNNPHISPDGKATFIRWDDLLFEKMLND